MVSARQSGGAFKFAPMIDQPRTQPNQAHPGQPGRQGGLQRPGQQRRRRQVSRYGSQMAEKQQLKEIYGVRERQLKNYYSHAKRSKGQTGAELLAALERRLDNAVFRAGFAVTRPASRQMVSHGYFKVNGKVTNVASHGLRPGDVVSIKETKRKKAHFVAFPKSLQNVTPPAWIVLDPSTFSFKVSALPQVDDSPMPVDIQAVVEFFAR